MEQKFGKKGSKYGESFHFSLKNAERTIFCDYPENVWKTSAKTKDDFRMSWKKSLVIVAVYDDKLQKRESNFS